jgi:hypothetical protein
MALYGRDDLVWDELARAGLEFLVERARMGKLTSYTELNATLVRRKGSPALTSAAPTSAQQWAICSI